MVYANMRKMMYSLIITGILLFTVVGTSSAGETIRTSTASLKSEVSEENGKTICTSAGNQFTVLFGVIITDAIITEVILWPEENYYIFFAEPLQRVTVIGFGTYAGLEPDERFYMKTFYNVTSIMGGTYKETEVTEEYQTVLSFHTPVTPCILYFS